MICKKVTKHKNKAKSDKIKKTTQIKRRSTSKSSISGAKQNKINSKSVSKSSKNSNNKKKISDNNKKSDQSSHKSEPNVKNLRLSPKKESNDSKTNKSLKSSKIKKIKEIAKKVKTKTSDTTNTVKEVIKRNLRNNFKIESQSKETKMKINDKDLVKTKTNTKSKDKSSKRSPNCASNRDNEKISLRNGSQNTTKSKLCSKLLSTFDCIKTSNNKNQKSNKNNKNTSDSNHDSKAKLRNYVKTETINHKKDKTSEKMSENSSKSKDKDIKEKTKSSVAKKTTNTKNGMKSNIKTNVLIQNKNKTKINNKNKSTKTKNKSNKVDVKPSSKSTKDKKQTNGSSYVKRGHRLASLNAKAKVKLLCENETIEENRLKDKQNDKKNVTKTTDNQRSDRKTTNKRDDSKALVPVDNSRKQVAVRKRKLVDDSIEIIDTRSCKRMASLNASAIMAASYSPERYKRSKSVESNHSNNSVEMVREMQTFSHTVSRYEITPSVNGINGIHVNHLNQVSQQNSVILSAQKHETIETVKQLKVSNKIKDRLLGIARLERHERAKQKKRDSKNQSSDTDQSLIPGEVSGYQATKVLNVTKVTHINTSQGLKKAETRNKDKKSGHQIDSILETDSSVVHKYQVQTKATIQMQTTFNSSNVPNPMANVTTITASQPTATTRTGPQMQIHLADAQMIPTFHSSGQPTYFNLSGPTPAMVQVHNNHYQTMGAPTPSLTPMPIISLSDHYPTHYSSAFSVPHFATHSHPTQTPFNYFNPGLYQPAGPLLQAFQDPCLIHKPIPFHPPAPQVSHIHNSPQFTNSTQTGQTFATEMSQPFASSPQFYSQMQTPMRTPQTVFFQALPQTNTTAFTLLNPSVPYTHPTVINSEQFITNRENPILANETTFLSHQNTPQNVKITSNTNPLVVNPTNDSTNRQNISKSIQCSPQSRNQFESSLEKQFCDSTNSSVRMSDDNRVLVNSVETQINRKFNKSDLKCDKKKKSLLLKPNRKTDEVIVIRNNRNNSSQTISERHQSNESLDKTSKNTLTPFNLNKTNSSKGSNISHNKHMKTVCLQINTPLPSVSVPSTPSPSSRHLPLKKSKKRFSHGWSWEGSPKHKYVYLNNEEQSYLRKCYPAIRHNEGDIIQVRDCVLLRSGPRKTDLPFVAKIAALWESPEGEMMMSLLWYYRPEHTDLEYYSNQMCSEIFASKHRDINSVACIDDKCYVLTYNEFCRYRRSKLEKQPLSRMSVSLSASIVPPLDEPYPRAQRMPPIRVFPELVFCCRKVYDYRQKRILKNPL